MWWVIGWIVGVWAWRKPGQWGVKPRNVITLQRPTGNSRLKITDIAFTHHAPAIWTSPTKELRCPICHTSSNNLSSSTNHLVTLSVFQFHSRLRLISSNNHSCTFLDLVNLRLLTAFNIGGRDQPPVTVSSGAPTSQMISDPIGNTRQRSQRTENGWRQSTGSGWNEMWAIYKTYLSSLAGYCRTFPNIPERCRCVLENFTPCKISIFIDGFGLPETDPASFDRLRH